MCDSHYHQTPFGWAAPDDLILTEIHSIRPCRVFEINPETKALRRLWPSRRPTITAGRIVRTVFIDGGSGPEPILSLEKVKPQ